MKSCLNVVTILVALVVVDSVTAGSFGDRLFGRKDCCPQKKIVGYRWVPAPTCRVSTPVVSAPIVSAPIISTPIVSTPVYSAPVTYSAPIVSAPARSCCNCCCCCCCCGGGGSMGGYVSSADSFEMAEDVTYESFAGALENPIEAEVSTEGVFVEGEMPMEGYSSGESIDGIFDDGSMSHLPIEDPTPADAGKGDVDGADDAGDDDLTDSLEDALGARNGKAGFSANTRMVFVPKKRSARSSSRSSRIVTSSLKRSGQSQVQFVRSQRTTTRAKRSPQKSSKPVMRLIFAPVKK